MPETRRSALLRQIGFALLAIGMVLGPAVLLSEGGGRSLSVLGIEDEDTDAGGWPAGYVQPEMLGASGVLPGLRTMDPVMVASLAAESNRGYRPVTTVNPLSIPALVFDAYQRTERILAERVSGCGLRWPLLAAVGRVVSDHARGGGLDAGGTTSEPILGPQLDGRGGRARVADTENGRLDGDVSWDRAAGPLQIIPQVWQRVGADSDGNGTADPHNVYDAALAAGRFLCEDGADLHSAEGQVRAAFRYQRTEPFVRATMAWAWAYGSTAVTPEASPTVAAAFKPVLPAPETIELPERPPMAPALPRGPAQAPASQLTSSSPLSGGKTDPGSSGGTTPAPPSGLPETRRQDPPMSGGSPAPEPEPVPEPAPNPVLSPRPEPAPNPNPPPEPAPAPNPTPPPEPAPDPEPPRPEPPPRPGFTS